MPDPFELDPEFSPGEAREGRDGASIHLLGLADSTFQSEVVGPATAFARAAAADAPQRPWYTAGAASISGRVRALVQDPGNPRRFFAGLARGGVYRSVDAGDNWDPCGWPEDTFSVGSLALAPSDARVLYVGTGEPGAPGGGGLRRSLDGGETFSTLVSGLPATPPGGAAPAADPGSADHYFGLAVDPLHPFRFWTASDRGLWRYEPNRARSPRSRDPILNPRDARGAFSEESLGGNTGQNITDILLTVDPTEKAPVAGRERKRLVIWVGVAGRAFDNAAAGALIGVYRGVFDRDHPGAAIAFTQQNLGAGYTLPAFPVGGRHYNRTRLAASPSNPKFVYAVVQNGITDAIQGIFQTTDGGATPWTQGAVPDPGGQSWAALAIAVHPRLPRTVAVGCLDIYLSVNGGGNFNQLLNWLQYDRGDRAQHADQHALIFDASDPNRLWAGNDGGISMARSYLAVPAVSPFWRRRSHGLLGCQFNYLGVSSIFPSVWGGGMQDNGTFVSFSGGSWTHISGGDGGSVVFDGGNPRRIYTNFQSGMSPGGSSPFCGILNCEPVLPGTPLPPNGGLGLGGLNMHAPWQSISPSAPELGAPPASTVEYWNRKLAPPAAPPTDLFVGYMVHPQAGEVMSAQTGAAFHLTGLPAAPVWTQVCPLPASPALISTSAATPEISALAFAVPPDNLTDRWVGTDQGQLFVMRSGAPPAIPVLAAYTDVTANLLAALPAGVVPAATSALGLVGKRISCVAVHPLNKHYIAVSLAGDGGWNAISAQGRVLLSIDAGMTFVDISGRDGTTAANRPRPIPPGPVSCLCFDPTRTANQSQILYIGTVVGVWKMEALPRADLPAGTAIPAVPADWKSFGNWTAIAAGDPRVGQMPRNQLPMTVINHLIPVSYPRQPAASDVARDPYPTAVRHKLRAGTYSRGVWECDLDSNPANPPRERLFMRQYVVEDGMSYARPTLAILNGTPLTYPWQWDGDPRFPAVSSPIIAPAITNGSVPLVANRAYDLRTDSGDRFNAAERVDGVEFDEDMQVEPLTPAEPAFVYVQVHNRGVEAARDVTVHLFYAPLGMAAAAPVTNASDEGVPDLPADFWAHFTDADLPTGDWRKAGTAQSLSFIRPLEPEVVRFVWQPPSRLGNHSVALLAVCSSPRDLITTAPLPPTDIDDLVFNERRAILRVVPVNGVEVYIRDGVDDRGGRGAVVWGGRSPDLAVVRAPPADMGAEFGNLADPRTQDGVSAAGPNLVYVRVWNRQTDVVQVNVTLYWARASLPIDPTDANRQPVLHSQWTAVPANAAVLPLSIPAEGNALADFTLPAIPDPDTAAGTPYKAIFLAALVEPVPPGATALPDHTKVTDVDSFWSFFRAWRDAGRAAFRAVRYLP